MRIAVYKKQMYRKFMQRNNSSKSIEIDGKAFVFGGAYGNLQATQAILEKARELGFKSSQIIFTGDMIAYCAKPVETIDLIKSSVNHIIMGNCEEAISAGSNDCGCGFKEGSECSVLSNQWYNFCLSKVDQDTAEWMGTLPRELMFEIAGFNFLSTHATPSSINEFIFPSNAITSADTRDVDGYIVGHSGIPHISQTKSKPWINSGASGMPANDGTARVWFATLEAKDDELTIETQSVEYDHKQAQVDMQNAGLVNGYMECLATGFWPSDDILPYPEKALAGTPLKPQKKAFKRTPFRKTILA